MTLYQIQRAQHTTNRAIPVPFPIPLSPTHATPSLPGLLVLFIGPAVFELIAMHHTARWGDNEIRKTKATSIDPYSHRLKMHTLILDCDFSS